MDVVEVRGEPGRLYMLLARSGFSDPERRDVRILNHLYEQLNLNGDIRLGQAGVAGAIAHDDVAGWFRHTRYGMWIF